MRVCLVSIVLLIAGAVMNCGTEQPVPDPMDLVNIEREFAAYTAEQGMRDGFMHYAADNGLMFTPRAVNVKQYYGSREPQPGLLTWEPVYAEIAGSADLGWTTGPWDWRPESIADTPQVSGHYVTIWRLQPDTTWKFVIDIGVSHGPHEGAPPALETRTLNRRQLDSTELGAVRGELVQIEREFSDRSASDGLTAAYGAVVDDDIRLYRSGTKPVVGQDAVMTRLADVVGSWTWEPTRADVSADGGLAYVHGVSWLTDDEAGEMTVFSYVRIWRKNDAGDWKLALDIHIPLPAPEHEVES